jgi:hypothetical protein
VAPRPEGLVERARRRSAELLLGESAAPSSGEPAVSIVGSAHIG